MSRVARFGRYAAWNALDQVVMLGVPRLVLFPILAFLLGDTMFGTFVLALGLVQCIGLSPSQGLSSFIIREAVQCDAAKQQLMVRTVLLLCLLIMVPICVGLGCGTGPIARIYDKPALVGFLPCLSIYLLLMDLATTAQAIWRVRRAFWRLVVIHAVHTALLFLAVPFYLLGDVNAVARAYILGGVGALAVVLLMGRRSYRGRPLCSRAVVRSAMGVWIPMSLSALMVLSAGYLDRVLLGLWWPAAEVAVFFAAVSPAMISVIPAGQLSHFALSLLGQVKSRERFGRGFYAAYAAGACLWALLVFGVLSLLGQWLLTTLYPDLADRALPLWHYALAAYGAVGIGTSCRPFVIKFLSPRLLLLLTAATLVGRMIPLLVLVPAGGALGAARAMLIGASIQGSLWLGVFVRRFVMDRPSEVSTDA
ncbi:MAG: oligosaccharide flippase family protein [bacterium]|nr:oligosaccharide flippase family protein [bacterium]